MTIQVRKFTRIYGCHQILRSLSDFVAAMCQCEFPDLHGCLWEYIKDGGISDYQINLRWFKEKKSWVLVSYYYIAVISPLRSVNVCFMYFGAPKTCPFLFSVSNITQYQNWVIYSRFLTSHPTFNQSPNFGNISWMHPMFSVPVPTLPFPSLLGREFS